MAKMRKPFPPPTASEVVEAIVNGQYYAADIGTLYDAQQYEELIYKIRCAEQALHTIYKYAIHEWGKIATSPAMLTGTPLPDDVRERMANEIAEIIDNEWLADMVDKTK